MANLGIGTISVGSSDRGFSQVFPSIGSTTRSLSVGSSISAFSYPISIVGFNTRSSVSIASTLISYSAPFTNNTGVGTNVSFSGLITNVAYGTTQIDLGSIRPMWKSYVFVGIAERPSVGQVFPRGL